MRLALAVLIALTVVSPAFGKAASFADVEDEVMCVSCNVALNVAESPQADAERKHSEIMGTTNQQRTVLEGRLEQLRTFEREYRTRLKTYLESQLEELGQRGSAARPQASRVSNGSST